MLTNYKLFIYEELDSSIRKNYWMQMNDENGWNPITDEFFNQLCDEGWIEDLDQFYDNVTKDNITVKELELIDEDKKGLMSFDGDTMEDFNELDIEIKDSQKYPYNMLDMIDYDKGIVYILKYKS